MEGGFEFAVWEIGNGKMLAIGYIIYTEFITFS
jgi:hypothetical protein